MLKINLKEFFWPNKLKLAFFLLLLLISSIGWFEGWIFADQCSRKPILFDYVPRSVGSVCLIVTMMVMLPVGLLQSAAYDALSKLGYYGLDLQSIFLIAGILYLYLLACIFSLPFEKKQKPDYSRQTIIFTVFFLVFLFLAASACLNQLCYKNECFLSDEQYINIAKTTPEAKAFLQKYADTNTVVERTEYVAVEFWVGNFSAIRGIYEEGERVPSLMLKVFIDPSTNKPSSALIQCHPTIDAYIYPEGKNLVEYIKTEKCLA